METIEIYRSGLNSDDLREVCDLLRGEDIFTPSFISTEVDIYDPLIYARQKINHKTETILLPDRNVVTRWLALLDGVTAKSEHRIAAAVMAFSQCAGIQIEPNIALYEAAAHGGNEAANEELHRFRAADNLPPSLWASTALGRTPNLQLLPENIPHVPERPPVNFVMPLRRWRRNYIITLKIAELELRGGKSEERMAELLRWMYEDFLIGGPAIIFATHYLAPNSERKRLFKNLRSPDRERAILGVRNAAWDLSLLSKWIRKIQAQEDQNALTLLCSLDKKLNEFARRIADSSPVESSRTAALSNIFNTLWGASVGGRLTSLTESYLSGSDNPARHLNRPDRIGLIDHLIDAGETLLRKWRPGHR